MALKQSLNVFVLSTAIHPYLTSSAFFNISNSSTLLSSNQTIQNLSQNLNLFSQNNTDIRFYNNDVANSLQAKILS